jgi:hypothetical protein
MKSGKTSAPKIKVVLTWLALLTFLTAVFVFWTWWMGLRHSSRPADSEPTVVFSIVMVFIGFLFLGAGVAGYVAALFTNCLTFNLSAPAWIELKVKLYFANIFIPLAGALGFGFMLSAFLSPVLVKAGLNPSFANIIPVMGMVFILQIAQLWILIWGPLEKRFILKRLAALGLTPAQLAGAFLVGLSNPQRSSFKKFGTVEEDVGALWVGPDQLIYYGDGEQFGLTRSQVTQIERKSDSGSTSMLGGIAHVVLHVVQADGSVRQIRLHNEGLLTMGQKRVAMEQLAEAIENWHGNKGDSPATVPTIDTSSV